MENPPIKLVVADDHTLFRKGIIEVLSTLGDYKILFEAADGAELIRKLHSISDLPDVCLLDVSMPNMSGLEAAAIMTKKFPEVRIIALSMFNTELTIIKMIRHGARGYLLKESEPEELNKAINDVVTKGFYHSDLMSNRLVSAIKQENKNNVNDISDNEIEFLRHCCSELTYAGIAVKMNVSARTVEGYRETMSRKIHVKTRIGLAMFATHSGLIHKKDSY